MRTIGGFPKLGVPFWGSHRSKLGSLIQRNYPISLCGMKRGKAHVYRGLDEVSEELARLSRPGSSVDTAPHRYAKNGFL